MKFIVLSGLILGGCTSVKEYVIRGEIAGNDAKLYLSVVNEQGKFDTIQQVESQKGKFQIKGILDNPKIGLKEAEALYAGIFLDTKGFTFKTGVRTFEAAAYLRRMGVDPVNIRRLFKTDIRDSVRLSKVISSAKIYRDNIAVAVCEDTGKDLQVLVAKAADELLNISGIEASFVIARLGHKIIISGRSLETVNVQLILERLGGGGHITIAGAQLSNQDMDIALEQLQKAIDDVLDDRE